MRNDKSLKLGLWTVLLASVVGLSACQKDANDAETVDEGETVTMSAEPAETNDPAIVASDLDDADAQSDEAVESNTIDADADAMGEASTVEAEDSAATETVAAEEGSIDVDAEDVETAQ